MTRVLSLLLLLAQLPVLAAESPAPPVFDPRGRTLGPPLSERVTDYEIDARLDPTTHTLTGQELITWRNRSAEQAVLIARLGFSLATTAVTVDVYRAMVPLPVQVPEAKPAPEPSASEPTPAPAAAQNVSTEQHVLGDDAGRS